MATKKTTNKASKKVNLNLNIDKPSKKTNNKLKKQIKKIGIGSIIVIIFLIAIGGVGGYFGFKYLTRNDCFTLVGQDEITLQLNTETYTDEGAKVIAFGIDDSSKVEIETNLIKQKDGSYSANEVGTYYIIYRVKNLKYGTLFKIEKIRLITFVEASEGGYND